MESETLEYKRELTDGFEKEVVAFLNMQGGQIVIGKADDGTICPLESVDKTALAVADRIKNIQKVFGSMGNEKNTSVYENVKIYASSVTEYEYGMPTIPAGVELITSN